MVDGIEAGQHGVDVVLVVAARPPRAGRRRRRRAGGGRLGGGGGPRRGCAHGRRLGRGRRGLYGFRLRERQRRAPACRGGRLGFVVGDDSPDRRQNLLHRGLLDLCRLRHLPLHIVNARTFYTKAARDWPASGIGSVGFSSRKPDLSPDQACRSIPVRAAQSPLALRLIDAARTARIATLPVDSATAGPDLIASNEQQRRRTTRLAIVLFRALQARNVGNSGAQRPSGVRTPTQLSRT